MLLSTNVSFSDWTCLYGTWDTPGVRRIIDFCLAGGIKKIYWRFFYGGIAAYHSRIERVANGKPYGDKNVVAQLTSPGFIKQFNQQGYGEAIRTLEGYKHWNPIGEAIEYAHRCGLELYAWVSLENDHGGGLQSKLAGEHPEYAHVDRWGNVEAGCLSFSFPEVRKYKISLIKEIAQMPVDGIWLDFGRCAPGLKLDEKGVNVLGYDRVAVEEFKKECGISPQEIPNHDKRWVDFRARYGTLFLKELRAELKHLKWRKPIYADVAGESVEESVPQKFADVNAWCREKLVDGVLAGYYGFSMPRGVKKVFRRRIWKAHPDIIEQLVALCQEHGFDEVLFQESDNLQTEYLWNTLARLSISPCFPSKPMRGITAGKIKHPIAMKDTRGAEKDWRKAEKADSFIEHTQVTPAHAPFKTEAKFLWDAKHLYVRVECRGMSGNKTRKNEHKLKIVGGGIVPGNDDFVMVCLDTQHDHQTCSIFRVNRIGEFRSFRRTHDEPLEHWGNAKDDSKSNDIKYSARVVEQDSRWLAILKIPFKELTARPRSKERWGLNICRFVPAPAPPELGTTRGDHFVLAEAIFCSWVGKRYDQFWTEPKDYGHLIF